MPRACFPFLWGHGYLERNLYEHCVLTCSLLSNLHKVFPNELPLSKGTLFNSNQPKKTSNKPEISEENLKNRPPCANRNYCVWGKGLEIKRVEMEGGG